MLKKIAITVFFCTSFLYGWSQPKPDSVQLKRLIRLCELWGKVKYFHPYLSYKPIDWDSALIQTIPKVKAAQTSSEYARAIDEMLGMLHDPATYVIREPQTSWPLSLPGEAHPKVYNYDEEILVIEMTDYSDLSNLEETERRLKEVKSKMVNKKAVVFDIRKLTKDGFTWGSLEYYLRRGGLIPVLCPSNLQYSGQRYRVNYGALTAAPSGGFYQAGFLTLISPSPNYQSEGATMPLVFLVNDHTEIPAFVLALQKAGKAAIISEGNVTDEKLVKKSMVDLGESYMANVRVGEVIFADGTVGFAPDVFIGPYTKYEEALQFAIHYAESVTSGKVMMRPSAKPASILPYGKPDKKYEEMKFPPEEYRLLAAFRIWNMIEYFFPFKDLMDKKWSQVLPQFIPKFQRASSEKDYNFTVAEMVACLQDSHGAFTGISALTSIYGKSIPPLLIRMIQHKPVVYKVAHDSITQKYGVRVGDEILKVDGENAVDRIKRFLPYLSYSTPDVGERSAGSLLLTGVLNSEALLEVRNGDGVIRNVKLPRSSTSEALLPLRARTTEVVKELENQIGYIDMDRLKEDQLEEVKALLGKVKSVILDMRGYPVSGAPYQVSSWLSPNVNARVEVPVTLSKGEGFEVMRHRKYQYPTSNPNPNRKLQFNIPSAVLINEFTASAAENFAIEMDQSPNTTIVGSNSSGADGAVSIFFIPGGLPVIFTAADYTYEDGRQLQRVGVIPDIYTKPTLKGFRKGKDEVLEKAIAFLKTKRSK
ncbi:MAG: hypothetical protein JSS79_17010 [Bacteroidetes bacterium]|nr:hypothetical protein [Bacteroidota bacterium]